jgi:hypothetical protein
MANQFTKMFPVRAAAARRRPARNPAGVPNHPRKIDGHGTGRWRAELGAEVGRWARGAPHKLPAMALRSIARDAGVKPAELRARAGRRDVGARLAAWIDRAPLARVRSYVSNRTRVLRREHQGTLKPRRMPRAAPRRRSR